MFGAGLIVFLVFAYLLKIELFPRFIHLGSIAYLQSGTHIINICDDKGNIKVEAKGKASPAKTIKIFSNGLKGILIARH
jgi:hypothetical protein